MGRVQRLRQEQTQARMNLIMLRWAKASMVNAYYTWKDYALIPENKVNRLVTQLDSFALQQPYPTPSTGIIHHGHVVALIILHSGHVAWCRHLHQTQCVFACDFNLAFNGDIPDLNGRF